MTATLEPVAPITAPPAPDRRRWALVGAATGLLSAIALFGVSILPIDDADLADNAQVLSKVADVEVRIWIFQTSSVLIALGLVVFGAGLHRLLRRGVPADSLLPTVAFSGTVLTATMVLVGGGISTELFWSLVHDTEIDPDTVASHLAVFNTMAWVWAGLALTMGALAVAVRRFGVAPRWIGRMSSGAVALVALTQVVPLQYLAVVPGILWLITVGIGLARADDDEPGATPAGSTI